MARILARGLEDRDTDQLHTLLRASGHILVRRNGERPNTGETTAEPPDLAVVGLDGMDGVARAQALVETYPDLPLVVVLQTDMQPWDSTVQQLCPVAFMPLPLVQDTVLSAVRTALREADRRKALADYQTLVENQTDLVVRLAPNLDVLYASPSYCRMFDVSAKDVQNRPFTPRVHPDDINRVKESLATLTRPPYTCRHRERAMTKTGWRHFEWAARAQLDRSGAIAEIISVGRDITDQAVAEEEREAYRDELDRAQELAQLGTWTYDVTTGAIIWSRGMARIVGASESAPPSPDDVRPLVHPDDWRGFKDAIVRAAEEAKGFRMEIRISRPDSRHRHLLVSCEPERGPDGAVVRLLGGAQDVTELEEARSRNRELTEFPARNPYPVLRMSDRGDILYANEASQPILDHWGAAVGGTVPSPWDRQLAEALASGKLQHAEMACGNLVYALAFAPVPEGRFVHAYGMDITGLHEAQRHALALKAFYQTVLENVQEGVWVTDSRDRVTFANPALGQIEGVDAGGLVGKNVLTDVPELSADGFRPYYEEAQRSGVPVEFETRAPTFGGYASVRSGWLVPRMNGGRFEGMICTCRDVTRSIRDEQELRLKSSAMENSLTGFYVLNTEGRFVYVNQAFLRMWGYEEPEEILGTSVVNYCQDPGIPRRIMQALRSDGQCSMEFAAKRRDGTTFDIFMSEHLHRDGEKGELCVGSVIDISERKKAERLLARHHDELEEAVQQRTGELRTMVNSMVGREIRMSELKEDVRALREQLRQHGYTPVADDPLGDD